MENAILDIQNVSVRFANGSAVQAVEQVSLSVFPSDKLCIIGETGSGKSILLLSVLRLLPASAVVSGDVCFHGQSLFALSPKQMDGVRGGQISYVPQGSGNGMNPLLSVGFQVGEPLIAHRSMNKKRAIARAVELMRRFHLGREEELARQYPYTLSGGMRQRALIAMGISADAELLLFDEPTKGLDEARIRLVADTLNELDGQTMVCVTHDLSFARDIANRIGVMYAANLIEVADADELYAHPLYARYARRHAGKRAAFPPRLCPRARRYARDRLQISNALPELQRKMCRNAADGGRGRPQSEVLAVCVKPSWRLFR